MIKTTFKNKFPGHLEWVLFKPTHTRKKQKKKNRNKLNVALAQNKNTGKYYFKVFFGSILWQAPVQASWLWLCFLF